MPYDDIDGLILADLNTQPNIDVAIDGADECDTQLNLVCTLLLPYHYHITLTYNCICDTTVD
jgi:hypothetical protein